MDEEFLTAEYLVHPQFHKIKNLIIVERGTLKLTLPRYGYEKIFEKLRPGSSIGQYSILRSRYDGEGFFKFKVSSLRNSRIFKISSDLLMKVRTRYKGLDNEINKLRLSIFMINQGAPMCDFHIDYNYVSDRIEKVRDLHKQKTRRNYLLSQLTFSAE